MIAWLRERSLAQQVIAACFALVLALTAAIYFFQVRSITSTVLRLAEAHAAQTAPVAAAAFSTAIVQGDFASLNSLAKDSLSHDGIAKIEIRDTQGKLLATAGEEFNGVVLLTKEVPLVIAGQALGSARLTFSGAVIAEVEANLFIRRLLMLLLTLTVVGIGTVAITGWVLRPLSRLGDAAKALAQGQYDIRLPKHSSRELNALQDHFSGMAQAIQEKITALKASEALQRQYLADAQERAEESDNARSVAESALHSAEEARRSADLANTAKSQFLSKVTHELRTPLNGVLGMLELLQGTRLDPEQQELAGISKESGESLLAIINDILDFSKIEVGEFSVDRHPFALHHTLHSTVQLFSGVASRKGLALREQIDDSVPQYAFGDALRLRQVLSNLISNAIKFTVTGEVSITARYEAAPGLLQVSVRDTGIGIAPEALHSIFEPFVQADNTMTRRFGGTGLGLSIVKNLAESMGGAVEVSSAPGGGSAFSFWLPMPVITGAAAAEPAVAPELPLTGMRVLIAEDNTVNLIVAQRLLAHYGCIPASARDGQEALEMIASNHFDAVLMDCQMPVLDGLQATALIRAREKELGLPALLVIGVTANAHPEDRAACLAAGMDDYLSKPYTRRALGAVLAKFYKAPGQ